MSSVVTVHVEGDTCACIFVTCREDTAPARRSVINLELGINLCGSNGNVRQRVRVLTNLAESLNVLKRSVLVGISKYDLIVSSRNDALLNLDVAEAECKCAISLFPFLVSIVGCDRMRTIINYTKLDAKQCIVVVSGEDC